MRIVFCVVAIVALGLVGCTGAEKQEQKPVKQEPVKVEGKGAVITLTSPAFEHGGPIPRKYTGEGENVSPPLSWTGAPEGAKEFALICDDPDAPRADPWVHWVLYKIPADRNSLAEGSAAGAVEGKGTSGRSGYSGPMPPPGHGVHHYHFKLYALDQPIDLKPGAGKDELLKAVEDHVLAEGELIGTYER